MENIKSYLIDFAEGRVEVPEFLEHCEKHPEVLDYLTQIASPTFKTYITHKRMGENGFPQYYCEELPFDAKMSLEQDLKSVGGMLGKYLNIHGIFSKVIVEAFTDDNIVIDDTFQEKFCFMLDACPE